MNPPSSSRSTTDHGATQHHPEDQAQGEGDAHPHGVGSLWPPFPYDPLCICSPWFLLSFGSGARVVGFLNWLASALIHDG